jgi:hypothetical protein
LKHVGVVPLAQVRVTCFDSKATSDGVKIGKEIAA